MALGISSGRRARLRAGPHRTSSGALLVPGSTWRDRGGGSAVLGGVALIFKSSRTSLSRGVAEVVAAPVEALFSASSRHLPRRRGVMRVGRILAIALLTLPARRAAVDPAEAAEIGATALSAACTLGGLALRRISTAPRSRRRGPDRAARRALFALGAVRRLRAREARTPRLARYLPSREPGPASDRYAPRGPRGADAVLWLPPRPPAGHTRSPPPAPTTRGLGRRRGRTPPAAGAGARRLPLALALEGATTLASSGRRGFRSYGGVAPGGDADPHGARPSLRAHRAARHHSA